VRAKSGYERVNVMIRSSPRYRFSAVGKLNSYSLFAESAWRATASTGRLGMVLPVGICTDDSTRLFFNALISGRQLVSVLGCYEVRRWFLGTDDRKSFCLFTAGEAPVAEMAFYIMNEHQFAERERRFEMTTEDLRLVNPNTGTCALFRSRRDAELVKHIYRRVPVLWNDEDDAGNPWQLSFSQGLFNMTGDSRLFESRPGPGRLPLYEGKMIHQFDHRWTSYESMTDGSIEELAVTDMEKANPMFLPRARYWVKAAEVTLKLKQRRWERDWIMGWRDIALASVERTVIASAMPIVAVGHTLPLFFCETLSAQHSAVLLANLNALILDYVARLKIGGTHLTYTYLKQFPVLSPAAYLNEDLEYICSRVLELSFTASDMAPWARDLGYEGPPFVWDLDRRALLRAELDAYYARLYRLTREELRYILDPADVMGPDYPSETFRVLKQNEERTFGEYRTRRLVLEAWDRLAAETSRAALVTA
jgi:hypothetical protein